MAEGEIDIRGLYDMWFVLSSNFLRFKVLIIYLYTFIYSNFANIIGECPVRLFEDPTNSFLQRVSIACYAERCISHDRFCLTV